MPIDADILREIAALKQQTDMRHDFLLEEMKELKDALRNGHYVTDDQYKPVRNLVYGLVGLILTSVIGAVLSLVIRAH